ncbi:MAG: ribbon-helix-helix protein, CopG family [Acidobacteriaceae bacterium]
MTYTTLLALDVPVELMSRLDEMARARNITRAELVRAALAPFAGVVLADRSNPHSNRDGKEADAIAIIREWRGDPVRQLQDRLADAGIKRGRSWVWEKRHQLQREA